MRRRMSGLLVFVLLAAGTAAGQTVDEVIAKNIAAHGGLEKLRAIQSMRVTGRMTIGPGLEFPVVMEMKRPMKMRMEFTAQGMTGVQAYDGTSGWQIMPFMGKKDPEPLAGDDLKDAQEQADFEGPLVDYKAKGHQVELLGKENIEGAECYKIKLTKKNGDIQHYFLDTESFLELKITGKRMIRGTEVEFENSLGDYKDVGGIIMAHSVEVGAKGQPQRQRIIFERVELNVEIDDSRFMMPAPAPAEPKPAETKPPVNDR